jgi:DNA-binding LytR/AlgR family response regulator
MSPQPASLRYAEAMPSVPSPRGVLEEVPPHGSAAMLRREPAEKYLNRIAVKSGDRIVLVSMSEVFWIQSHGNLLRLHLQNAGYEHRITIKEFYRRLNPEHFVRVHRNAIVNLDHVLEFDLPRCGNAFVYLCNGKALPISGTARSALRRGLLLQACGSTDIGDL